jgi:hypothetical protein
VISDGQLRKKRRRPIVGAKRRLSRCSNDKEREVSLTCNQDVGSAQGLNRCAARGRKRQEKVKTLPRLRHKRRPHICGLMGIPSGKKGAANSNFVSLIKNTKVDSSKSKTEVGSCGGDLD